MKKNIIHIILVLIFMAGCGDKALFTELATNRIKVIIKGTYESNDPRPWQNDFPNSDSVDEVVPPVSDEVSAGVLAEDAAVPTKFMLDIAELRISDGKHTQKFANYRKTYSSEITNDFDVPFFKDGVEYKNDDVRPDYTWRYIKMYVRKMLFDSAKIYTYNDNGSIDGKGDWAFSKNNQDVFAEKTVDGLNFNLFQLNSYYDSLLYHYGSINRIFPLVISIDDTFIFNKDIPETVLEIRFVVKNFIKKYELDYTSEDVRYVKHFYALSDWLRNVKPGRYYNKTGSKWVNDCEVMGRNVIAIARSYIPGQTVRISGSAGATACYVVAINENHVIDDYTAPDKKVPAISRPLFPNDEPKSPILELPLDLENVLDYYLKLEKYKDDYDLFIDSVDTGTYDDEWTAYEDGIEAFNIPALVTWSVDGSFTFTNVPVGHTYKIYRSSCSGGSCDANKLPEDFDTLLGSKTVSPEEAGQSLTVK